MWSDVAPVQQHLPKGHVSKKDWNIHLGYANRFGLNSQHT